MENIEERLILAGINMGIGMALGTIDVLTTSIPVLSAGLPLYNLTAFGSYAIANEEIDSEMIEAGIINLASHFLGASIPFAVKYHNEIINYWMPYLEKLI